MPREEKPRIPPERKPVSEFRTPVPNVVFYSELVNRDDPAYYKNAPVARGTLYSTMVGANQAVISTYPNLYFLRERKFAESDQLVFWDWATVPTAEDSYNAEISYVSEAVTFPAFTRVYTLRRDDYEASPTLAIGSPLTALLGITLPDGGGGYTHATGHIIGTTATIQFIISDGEIVSGVVTNEGTGVTSSSIITIVGDGILPTSGPLPIVQPTSCVLVSQKKEELPPDDPLSHEFVRVIRVYETLPGPWIFSTQIDEDGDSVTVQTRRNISANINTGETLIGTLWQETTKKGVDNFVAEETMESRNVPGAGILTTSRVDEDGKTITVTRQVQSAAFLSTLTPREYIFGGVWFRISSEPITDLKVWLVTEARPLPGNIIPSAVIESDNVVKTSASILQDTNLITPSVSQSGGVITTVDKQEVSDIVSKQVTSQKAIFDPAYFAVKIPIVIPEKFRAVTPTRTISHVLAGTASMPTLGAGQFESSAEQLKTFVEKTSVTSIDTTILPVSLISYKMTGDSQIETITETLATGLQTISPDVNTVEAEVDNLGAGISLLIQGEVPSLFTKPSYSISIPDVIPERFRAIAPTTTTALEVAGTASVPTLGTGDLEKSQTQETVFKYRQSTKTRSAVSLPISLVSTKMTGDQQVETLTETLATGLQTFNPNELTAEADVENLGNNTSLLSFGTVPSLFGANVFEISRPDLLPEKFRVDVPTVTTEVITAGTAMLPTLGTGEFTKSQQQLTAFKIRSKTIARAAVTLPISLISTKMTSASQVETITETLASGFQTFSPNSTMVEADVEDLGDGTSIMSVGTVPSLFLRPSYSTSIPDAVPERFRVVIPTQTTEIEVAGTAAMPTLTTGQLSASQSQETAFVYRSRITARAPVTLPVSLTSYKYSKDKQVITAVETYGSGLQTITPAALTVEAEVINTGDGNSLLTVGTVPTLFTQPSYSIRIPDPIPERFRVIVPTTTTSLLSIGTAAPPTLGTGDLSKESQQIDTFIVRNTTETRAGVVLPVSLQSYKLTKDKQVSTVTETLDNGLQTITPDVFTTEAEVINLGNATSLRVQGEVSSLFTAKSSATLIHDLVPVEFLGVIQTFETELLVAGNIVDPPVLGTGDLEKTETQVDTQTKRVRLKTRAGLALPVTLTGGKKIVTKFGIQFVADEIITLELTGTGVIPTGATVIEAEIKQIGSGMEVLTSLTIDGGVFPTVISTAFDGEMQIHYTIEEQVVATAYVDTSGPFFIETHRNLDQWRAKRRKVTKIPTANSLSTAIQAQTFAPFQFPGTLDAAQNQITNNQLGFRQTSAQLVPQTLNTWWVNSTTMPTIAVDLIIPDSITILATSNSVRTFHQVLHDDWTTAGGSPQFFPATTPSFTQYTLGTLSGTISKVAIVVSNVGSGYAIGDLLSVVTTNGNGTLRVDQVGISNSILAAHIVTSFPGFFGTSAATSLTGGVGTGATAVVSTFYAPVYDPASRWIGNPRTVAANITPTEIPNLWKITTRTVVMR